MNDEIQITENQPYLGSTIKSLFEPIHFRSITVKNFMFKPLYLTEVISGPLNERITTWGYYEAGEEARVYIKLGPENRGFDFCSVYHTGNGISNKPNDKWENAVVTVLYHGSASYYGGVNSVKLGSLQAGNIGEDTWGNIDAHSQIFVVLKEMEWRYCIDEAQWPDPIHTGPNSLYPYEERP